MKAIIKIDMDNAAFEDNPSELSRILRELAMRVEYSQHQKFVILDTNGNNVGSLIIKE